MNLKSYLKGIGIGVIVTALILTIATRMNPNKMTDEDIKARAKELGMVESSTLASSSGLSGQDNTISNTTDTYNKDSNENVSGSDNYISDDKNANSSEDQNISDNKDANTSDNDKSDNGINATDKNNSSDSKDYNVSDDKNSSSNNDKNDVDDNKSDNKDTNVTDNKSDNNDSKVTDNKNNTSNPTGKTVTVEIKSGMSSESAAAAAKEAGLVDDDVEFNKYLCENGYDKRLRVGVHDIPEGSDFETISKYMCGIE